MNCFLLFLFMIKPSLTARLFLFRLILNYDQLLNKCFLCLYLYQTLKQINHEIIKKAIRQFV